MKGRIERITRTDLARVFLWTGDGFERDAISSLTPRIYKNGARQAANVPAFSGYEWPILFFAREKWANF